MHRTAISGSSACSAFFPEPRTGHARWVRSACWTEWYPSEPMTSRWPNTRTPQARMPVAIAAVPITTVRRGVSRVLWRIGFSTKRYESQAGTIETAAAIPADHDPGQRAVANTMAGQCHRYQLYEMSPTKTAGRVASTRPTPKIPGTPAASRSTVPRTGGSALTPGKAVTSSYRSAVPITSAAPTQPSRFAATGGIFRNRPAPSASSAPAANSHARVIDE